MIDFHKYSTKSDVWSFGIVLWEIFSRGKGPYPGLSNVETVQYVTKGFRMEFPEYAPASVQEIVSLCWKASAQDRPNFSYIASMWEGSICEQQTKPEMNAEIPLYSNQEILGSYTE